MYRRRGAAPTAPPRWTELSHLVSAATTPHDARAILTDDPALAEALWYRFSGGRDGTFWHDSATIDTRRSVGSGPLVVALDRTVGRWEG